MEAALYTFRSSTWRSGLRAFGCLLAVVGASAPALGQTSIPVPNHSFEMPGTFFAFPDADIWEETGPVGSDPRLPGVVDTLDTGVFFNSPVDQEGLPSVFFITNADGIQLAFLGALDNADIAFFQQLADPYESNASYTLRVDVGESFFFPPLTFNPNDPNPPPNPDPALLSLRLFYEDDAMQKVTLAERVVSADELPNGADAGVLLVEFSAISPTTTSFPIVDPAVGNSIGIDIRPSVGLSGVWNLDNVRVEVTCNPVSPADDADVDGDVDLDDYAMFSECVSGAQDMTRPTNCPPCAFDRLDGDHDGDVDLHDYGRFAVMFGQ